MTSKPLVVFIGAGGTMMRKGRHPLDFHDYGACGESLSMTDLIASVPEIGRITDVFPYEFSLQRSTSFSSEHLLRLVKQIHKLSHSHSPDAFVIILGTATLEEVGFFIELTANCEQPIILVGAQRPINVLSSDVSINLYHATLVAVSKYTVPSKVVLVMNGEIHAPVDVAKQNTYALDTMKSRFGPIGEISPDGRVRISRKPIKRLDTAAFDLANVDKLPRVDIVYSYLGADGAAIYAYISNGTKGIVSAGMPPGVISPSEVEALVEARRRGIVVVQSTRASNGYVVRTKTIIERGFIAAGGLNPQKARILTMVALAVTEKLENLEAYFECF